MASQPLDGIEHVILVMFENRSFDNVLGAFYTAESSVDTGGVPKGWSNPWPTFGHVTAWQAPPGSAWQAIPYPDPNELYANMQAQMNSHGPMKGFVADYSTVPGANPPDIMQYFREENVPVTYQLATTYCASDRYFASGPVQTWPNRLFSLCGTPGWYPTPAGPRAYLNNTDYPDYPYIEGQLDLPCIFQQLADAGKSWRVYYDDEWPIAALVSYVWKHWHWIEPDSHVFGFEYFQSDLASGDLATFTLIEPRYQDVSGSLFTAPNSNHPGSSSAFDESGVPINVSCGERFLAQIYNALAASNLFDSTLLVVTYDEHGGVFDHVYPPPAPSPFRPDEHVFGFKYEQYGVRVPTLFINPHVRRGLLRPEPGSTDAFCHASILATLRDQFGLAGSLSPRVDKAPVFRGLIDRTLPPIPSTPVPVPPCVWDSARKPSHSLPIVASALKHARRWKSS